MNKKYNTTWAQASNTKINKKSFNKNKTCISWNFNYICDKIMPSLWISQQYESKFNSPLTVSDSSWFLCSDHCIPIRENTLSSLSLWPGITNKFINLKNIQVIFLSKKG